MRLVKIPSWLARSLLSRPKRFLYSRLATRYWSTLSAIRAYSLSQGETATKYASSYLKAQHTQEAVRRQLGALISSGLRGVQIAKEYQAPPKPAGAPQLACSGNASEGRLAASRTPRSVGKGSPGQEGLINGLFAARASELFNGPE